MNGFEGLIWILVGCWIPTRFTNTVLQRRLVLDVELVDSPLVYNEYISYCPLYTFFRYSISRRGRLTVVPTVKFAMSACLGQPRSRTGR